MRYSIYLYRSGLLIIIILLLNIHGFSQLSITSTGSNYTINCDNTVSGVNNGQYNGSGFTPNPAAGNLDSDAWASTGMTDNLNAGFGTTNISGDFAKGISNGGVTAGGFYAFQVTTGDYGFGVQPTDADWTPGTVTLRIINNTGGNIISIDISLVCFIGVRSKIEKPD